MKVKKRVKHGYRALCGHHAKRIAVVIAVMIVALAVVLSGCADSGQGGGGSGGGGGSQTDETGGIAVREPLSYSEIPGYAEGEYYVEINGGEPEFSREDIDYARTHTYEYYGDLDRLGRCTIAVGSLAPSLQPTGKRGDISHIHPSGWPRSNKDGYMTRTHLIAYMLAGENDNEKNLITGTKFFNSETMLEFEIAVDDYIDDTGNHVLYRVTPVYSGNEKVARGVQMEGYSVEDRGRGISFNIFAYNIEPGCTVDYNTGVVKRISGGSGSSSEGSSSPEARDYVLNTGSKKFHYPDCEGVADISNYKRKDVKATREELIDMGYTPCGKCRP